MQYMMSIRHYPCKECVVAVRISTKWCRFGPDQRVQHVRWCPKTLLTRLAAVAYHYQALIAYVILPRITEAKPKTNFRMLSSMPQLLRILRAWSDCAHLLTTCWTSSLIDSLSLTVTTRSALPDAITASSGDARKGRRNDRVCSSEFFLGNALIKLLNESISIGEQKYLLVTRTKMQTKLGVVIVVNQWRIRYIVFVLSVKIPTNFRRRHRRHSNENSRGSVSANFFTARRRHSCASAVSRVIILSVRLSVTRVVCDKTKYTAVWGRFDNTRKGNHSSILTPTAVGGRRPFRLKFGVKVTNTTPSKKADFDRFPLITSQP